MTAVNPLSKFGFPTLLVGFLTAGTASIVVVEIWPVNRGTLVGAAILGCALVLIGISIMAAFEREILAHLLGPSFLSYALALFNEADANFGIVTSLIAVGCLLTLYPVLRIGLFLNGRTINWSRMKIQTFADAAFSKRNAEK